MSSRLVPASFGEATAESERVVAWLRLPAIALIALGQGLEHPNPEEQGFLLTLALFSAWSAGASVCFRSLISETSPEATSGGTTFSPRAQARTASAICSRRASFETNPAAPISSAR